MCCWTIRARRASWSNARATSGISGCCRWRTTSAPARPCASRRSWCRTTRRGPTTRAESSPVSEMACGPKALRVDHIGSTAVPGMDAKDVIDVQVTVESLDVADELADALADVGYPRIEDITSDVPARRRSVAVAQAHSRSRRSRASREYSRPGGRLAQPAVRAAVRRLVERPTPGCGTTIWRPSASALGSPDYAEAKEPWFLDAYWRARAWADATGWHLPPQT